MPKDGFLGVGPTAHPTLIIFSFIKLINQPGSGVEDRADRLFIIWSFIKNYPDVDEVGIKGKDNYKPGDPRTQLIDQAFEKFRDDYVLDVEDNPNYQDERGDLMRILDKITQHMIAIVVDHKIIAKSRLTSSPNTDLDGDLNG